MRRLSEASTSTVLCLPDCLQVRRITQSLASRRLALPSFRRDRNCPLLNTKFRYITCREELGLVPLFKGLNITGSCHVPIQTGVLIKTLLTLSAAALWALATFSPCSSSLRLALRRWHCPLSAWTQETLRGSFQLQQLLGTPSKFRRSVLRD